MKLEAIAKMVSELQLRKGRTQKLASPVLDSKNVVKHSGAIQTTKAAHHVLGYSSWMVLAGEGVMTHGQRYAEVYQCVTLRTPPVVRFAVEVEKNNRVASSRVQETVTAANLGDKAFDPADSTVRERNNLRNPLHRDD